MTRCCTIAGAGAGKEAAVGDIGDAANFEDRLPRMIDSGSYMRGVRMEGHNFLKSLNKVEY